MTVIRPNSITGITSITAQANEINVFRHNGVLAGLQLNGVNHHTSAGVSTFHTVNVLGNLDVAGVLTYQDVTNVDSLGIGTFRTGINVSGGQLDVGSNIKLGNAGVITATSFVGSGAQLTGITQTTINSNTNNYLITGTGTANTLQGEVNLRFDGATLTVDGTSTDTPLILTTTNASGSHMRFQKDGSNKHFIGSGGGFGLGDVDDLSLRTVDNIIFGVGTSEKVRITSGGNIGVAGATGTDFSLLDGMVINTANGSAGLLINSSSSSHNAYLGFSYGSGSSTSHADQYSAYIGRVGDNTLVLGTNNSTRIYVTSDGDVAIGRDAALNNYAAGSTTTQLAVVKDGGAAGSGYHEVAHFTAGTDTNDTGAIVRITQFNNDRGLYIKGGRGTSDQAKAIFGLRNSSNSDSDVMIFEQGGRVTIPGQPSFAAYKSTNSYTQSGVIVFDSTRHNIGSHYNTSNGRFTAPVAGRYQFTFYSIIKGNYSNAYYSIQINGSAGSGMYVHVSENIGNLWEGECTTWILSLSAGDYVDINSNSSINWHGNDWQLFSGHLLG